MITKISIENFKCFGERVEIPIRPLTLLFGANSAGKSTIIQAIHYAREILERQNLDADKTVSGGDFINLGGFKNFVHDRDLRNAITLRFEMDYESESLDTIVSDDFACKLDIETEKGLVRFEEYGYESGINGVWIEFSVRYSQRDSKPYISNYSVGINGEHIASIRYSYGNVGLEICDLNLGHPIFFAEAAEGRVNILRAAVEGFAGHKNISLENPNIPFKWFFEKVTGAMPEKDAQINMVLDTLSLAGERAAISSDPSTQQDYNDAFRVIKNSEWVFNALMNQCLVSPCNLLRDELAGFRYIGPLREKPRRNFLPPRFSEPARWANGLAAWDVVYASEEEFVRKVGDKLADLETGYTLKREEHIMIPRNNYLLKLLASNEAFDLEEDEIWHEVNKFPSIVTLFLTPVEKTAGDEDFYPYQVLPDLDLLPADVGEGISQVFPLIVACLDAQAGITCLEQPELHLHPKQQAELGDLLIEAVKQNGKNLIIETHSEHLILRLLRRIRETTRQNMPRDAGLTPDDIAAIYVEQEASVAKAFEIGIDDKGEFLQPWPDSFFEQDFIERFSS